MLGLLNFIAAFFASQTLAVGSFSLLESVNLPPGWVEDGRADTTSTIKLHLAMIPKQQRALEQQALELSIPGSHSYGLHLEKADIERLNGVYAKEADLISTSLESWDVSRYSTQQTGNWLSFDTTIATAERLLNTTFHQYRHNGGTKIVRTLQYSVPLEVSGLIGMVQPTTHFGRPLPQASIILDKGTVNDASQIQSGFSVELCNSTITPDCLRRLYNLGDQAPNLTIGRGIGISGFLEQYARFADLALFANKFAPNISGLNFSTVLINGGTNTQSGDFNDSTEAAVDIQYTMALAPNIPITYFSTGGRGPLVPDMDEPSTELITNEPYLEELQYLMNLPDDKLPSVLTTSYGDNEQSIPLTYAREVCRMFMMLGMRGVSVIFASGDYGVGSSCLTNDGRNLTHYIPMFPASCPWVTSVGGVTGIEPENAASFSGGGFSNYFPQPTYQKDAVGEYLQCHGNRTSKLLTSITGRAYPDVAAQATNFVIVNKGYTRQVSGTSAAAPVVAAVIGKMNALRAAAGLPNMGFLNPFLYGEGRAGLNDITNGGSTGCLGISVLSGQPGRYVPYAGFNATVGWDPVTGLGTPDFSKLADAALKIGKDVIRSKRGAA